MTRIVVERSFSTPQSDEDMQRVADRERPCLSVYQVTWRRSLIATDRKRMICEYDAPDAETVRKIQREAAAEFDRVWIGEVVE
jgi:hypothetical protein